MKPPAFPPEARLELAETARHYGTVQPELGQRFYRVIDGLIADVCRTPGTFRYSQRPARSHFTQEFPYGIVYVDQPDRILILAVRHLHRAPGYWRHRLLPHP